MRPTWLLIALALSRCGVAWGQCTCYTTDTWGNRQYYDCATGAPCGTGGGTSTGGGGSTISGLACSLSVSQPSFTADGVATTRLTASVYWKNSGAPALYVPVDFEADYGITQAYSVLTNDLGRASTTLTTIDAGSYNVYARPDPGSWVSSVITPVRMGGQYITQTFPLFNSDWKCGAGGTPGPFQPAWQWHSAKLPCNPWQGFSAPFRILDWVATINGQSSQQQDSTDQNGTGSYGYSPCYVSNSPNTQKFWGELYLNRRMYGGAWRYNSAEATSNVNSCLVHY